MTDQNYSKDDQVFLDNSKDHSLASGLVLKRIPIRFCEFKISNSSKKMLRSETKSISPRAIQFASSFPFELGILMRIWIEMPDYWARKSRHVGYRHTDAPKWFQTLGRVTSCDEMNKRGNRFQILCETVNLDIHDERVLCDYLGLDMEEQ